MWSPDKKWIAYTLVGEETITLHIVDTTSQKVELLSQEIPRVAGDPPGETLVLLNGWSPDSQWLGYLIAYPGTFESYLLNIEDGTRLDITPPAGFLYWAQDGSGRFAYPDDWGNLYIGSIEDTTALSGIESSTYYIQSIDWHPTENQLLVTTAETTGWGDKIWRYDIGTDTWTLLKEINVRDAKWSPSGKQIAVYTGSSVRVFDTESLTINHTLGVSFDVFSIWWLDEQNLVLRVRGNFLITSVAGYDGSFYAIDEQDEIYQQMGFVKYSDW